MAALFVSLKIPKYPSTYIEGDLGMVKCASGSCTRPARPGKTKCEGCAESARRYYQNHKKSYPEVLKRHQLKKKFGLTLEEYRDQCERQNNLCALCGQPEADKRRGVVKALAVDHDHATGARRGLLCGRCNRILGMFNDDIKLFELAIEYLNKWGSNAEELRG